jgi:hypothetical protein
MAITVGVNAYITYAEFVAWADLRGYNITHPQAGVEEAIVIASLDFIDAMHNFKGDPVSSSQAMKLPTDQVTIANIKPAANAATKMQLEGLLMVDTSTTSASGSIESESKSVGPLSKSVTYRAGTAQTYKRITPLVDALLRPYLSASIGLVYRL